MSSPASLDAAVGTLVTIKTTGDEEVTGTIFALDSATGVLILKQPGSHGGVNNLRLLKTSAIQDVLHAQAPPADFDQKLPHVDLDRAKAREQKALQQAETDLAKIGVGVTKEAQSVFDALAKTMPCKWQERTIVVMDGILVHPPYSADSCEAASDEYTTGLARVQKVLQAERQRLGL